MVWTVKTIIQATILVIAILAAILFRKTIKRIYQATMQPIIRKSAEAFRVGL